MATTKYDAKPTTEPETPTTEPETPTTEPEKKPQISQKSPQIYDLLFRRPPARFRRHKNGIDNGTFN